MRYIKYCFTLTFFVAASNNSAPLSFSEEKRDVMLTNNFDRKIIVYDTIRQYEYQTVYRKIKGTVYHAVPNQTDNTPFITADNSLIDTSRINQLRWVALSRDILKRKFKNKKGKTIIWHGKIKLGDTIMIDYDSIELKKICIKNKNISYKKIKEKYEKVKGEWIVKDVMGSYHWKINKNINYDDLSPEMIKSGDYKIINNVVYTKIYQKSWIDFLQDHNDISSLYDNWNERTLVIKKKKIKSIKIVKKEIPF